jgi:hypothetical protein
MCSELPPPPLRLLSPFLVLPPLPLGLPPPAPLPFTLPPPPPPLSITVWEDRDVVMTESEPISPSLPVYPNNLGHFRALLPIRDARDQVAPAIAVRAGHRPGDAGLEFAQPSQEATAAGHGTTADDGAPPPPLTGTPGLAASSEPEDKLPATGIDPFDTHI